MSILPAEVGRISTRCGGWVASHWHTIHWLGLLQGDPWRLLPLDAPFPVAAARSLLSGLLEAGHETRLSYLAAERGDAQKVDYGHNKGSNSHADEWNGPVTEGSAFHSTDLHCTWRSKSSEHRTPVYPTVIIVVASTVVCRCANGGCKMPSSQRSENGARVGKSGGAKAQAGWLVQLTVSTPLLKLSAVSLQHAGPFALTVICVSLP